MVADGALLGSSFADYDMAAVRALPDTITFAGEDHLVFHVLQQLAVTLFVMFLDRADHGKLSCNLDKALFLRLFRHAGIHIRPLGILALGSMEQVLGGIAQLAQSLEPQLSVLLLVLCSMQEQGGNLLVARLLGNRGKVGVLIPSLRFIDIL